MKLNDTFYKRDDTVEMAKELIGKFVYTNIDGEITGGMIVETEAYLGATDSGCHSFNNKKTPKNATMFNNGGVAYMYICYGIHDMLNIVAGAEGTAEAILIRAIEPTEGIDLMQIRRGNVLLNRLAKGPGSLAKALGLNKTFDNISLLGDVLWIEDEAIKIVESDIVASPRIGLGCPEPYFSIPWRFFLKGNKFVSGKTNYI
ncbi:DNA-3-methyladenine glycosylase [Pedobacter sp. UYP30]|uniref:DNA-3-methyladenine glycosylase n=1 Tax=Pedobacter sp. UYP30 TaxID=1756400 RepID=UPI003395AADE